MKNFILSIFGLMVHDFWTKKTGPDIQNQIKALHFTFVFEIIAFSICLFIDDMSWITGYTF